MANGKTSGLVLCSHYVEQNRNASDGPIAILWDIKNCRVPSDIQPEDVAGNIRTALRVHPAINGSVNIFSAYGDFHSFSRRLREGCQRTGVKLIDVPCGKKGSVDMAILVDMFLFALDNHPPSSIMLITDDVDFSSALHVLSQRGYTVILAIPSGPVVSSVLSSAGSYVWDWYSLARGRGSVPPTKTPEEEEAVVCRETSAASHSSTEDDLMCRQPGDLPRLKGQLVKLLKTSGGCLSTSILRTQYEKSFGRPLFVSDYGSSKLVNLMKKMRDVISMEGQGMDRVVLLKEHSTNTNKEQKTEVICTQNKRKREEQEEAKASPRYNFRKRRSQCTTSASEGHNVQLPVTEQQTNSVQLLVPEQQARDVQLSVSEQQAHNVQHPVPEPQASEIHNVQLPVSEPQASEIHNVQLAVPEQQAVNKCP